MVKRGFVTGRDISRVLIFLKDRKEHLKDDRNHRYSRLLLKLSKIDLIVLDDWGIAPISADSRRDLLEILDDRYERKSTLITSQLPVDKWHRYLEDPTLADAILDRVIHNSYRKTQAINLTDWH